jgi:hypothetical protein
MPQEFPFGFCFQVPSRLLPNQFQIFKGQPGAGLAVRGGIGRSGRSFFQGETGQEFSDGGPAGVIEVNDLG